LGVPDCAAGGVRCRRHLDMPKRETPMVKRYWFRVGGTLYLEYPLVRRSWADDIGARWLDGLIIPDGESRVYRWTDAASVGYTPKEVVKGRHVIAVQAKYEPAHLCMPLMGQALIGVELLKRFGPASVRGVALCRKDDAALRSVFEAFPNMEVAVDTAPD
jgi:hypothetical protein